jgi:photosystem II stability/assembly factor-like uncharacterized protein
MTRRHPRGRRWRQRGWGAAVLVAAAAIAALIGFGGDSGGGAGTALPGRALGSHGSSLKPGSPPLGALPASYRANFFVFDPRDPQRVYVGASGVGGGRVLKTTDGGAHWHATATGTRASGWPGLRQALTADPRHQGTLYAGTEVGVYKTVDGGRSWHPSNRGLPAPTQYIHERPLGWVTALAVDPATPDIVYAGSDRVSKSSDAGRHWTTVFPMHATRHTHETVSALAIAPTDPETIYAIVGEFPNGSATPALGRTSIYRSADGGATWHATTVIRGSVAPTALAVEQRHPATVYAAISGKVMKSTNGGETWLAITNGLPVAGSRGSCHCLSQGGVRALSVDPRRSGTVYAALNQGGIYKTSNGGQTWISITPTTPLYGSTVAVDPARPTTIYAAGDGDFGGAQIFRSTSSGDSWDTAP